jgi:hypothetical protein
MKKEFTVYFPDGDYVHIAGKPSVSSMWDFAIDDIEILERGNVFSKCAADENYSGVVTR